MILSPNDGNHTSWSRYLWRNRRPRGAPVGRANAALAAEFQYFHRKTIARADSRAGAGQARRRRGESRAGRIAGRKGARDYGRRRSSNDVFPTAMHIASAEGIVNRVLPALQALRRTLDDKARDFADIVKIG